LVVTTLDGQMELQSKGEIWAAHQNYFVKIRAIRVEFFDLNQMSLPYQIATASW